MSNDTKEQQEFEKRYEINYLMSAQRDLKRLMDFLLSNEVSPTRAKEIILDIVKKLRVLSDNPHMGFSIGGKYGFETPYRALVCGKYLAVYEVIEAGSNENGRVEVRRIYHGREDYLSQLLDSRAK